MPNPTPYEFADALEPELKRLYLKLVGEARGRIPMADLQAAIEAKNTAEAIRIVDAAVGATNPSTAAAWRAAIEEVFGKTALSTASRVGNVFGFQFNLFDPGVLGQIDLLVAEQISVGRDAQLAIRDIVRRGWVEGITGPDQARMIRAMVGPTPGHAIAATNYYDQMINNGVDPALAFRNYELYENRLVNWRASTIARTENIKAANAGRMATWVQMVVDGFLEPNRMYLKWFVTDDDVLCPLCAPMDGVEIPFGTVNEKGEREGELFQSTKRGYKEDGRTQPNYPSLRPDPYGPQRDKLGRFIVSKTLKDSPLIEVLYPPLHPNCRCDIRLQIR